jgi:hypothetical protein
MRKTPIYVVDIFTAIVKKVSSEIILSTPNVGPVYFLYGHPIEAVNTILEVTKQAGGAGKKYPLIYMYMDFDEVHDGIEQAFKVNLHFAIATWTEAKWKSYERYINTFKTVLYPIYDEFIYQVGQSGYFNNLSSIPHAKTDRPFWGSATDKGNVAGDHCDVIEITDMKLNVLPMGCTTQTLNTILKS